MIWRSTFFLSLYIQFMMNPVYNLRIIIRNYKISLKENQTKKFKIAINHSKNIREIKKEYYV